MRQSMSRAGNCYENAFMESCFGTIKTELEMTEYPNRQTTRRKLWHIGDGGLSLRRDVHRVQIGPCFGI
jgi:transposase InsO family protein